MQSNSRLQVCACPVILMWSSPSLSPPFLLCRHIPFWVYVTVCVYLCVSQVRTRDLGGYSTTGDFVRAVVDNLRHRTVWRCLPLSIPDHPIHATSDLNMFKDDFKAALSYPTFSFPFSHFIFLIFLAGYWFLFLFLLMHPCTFIFISVCHSMNL